MASDVRHRILATTLDLIGERGIGGVSNRVIAKAAGVSLGTLTYHFASQERLLGEALNLFVAEEVERLAIIAEELEGTTVTLQEALAKAREVIEDRPSRQAEIAQLELYLHATRSDDLRDAAARCYAAYDQVATAMLKAVGVPEPERFAPLLGGLIDGFELRRLAAGDLAIDLDEAVAILVGGMAGRTDGRRPR
ncbi:MAG: TetR family transcriptional regulator [Nocardioidaceae bacterium]